MRLIHVLVLLLGAASLTDGALTATGVEAGGGGHGQCVPSPRDGIDEPIVIEGNCFEPAVLYVTPGTTVEWQQRDVIPHNVTLFGGELVGGKANLEKGERISYRFEEPGAYAFYCSVHPSMLGVVLAGDPASAEFGAGLSVQTTAEELRAIADYKQEWLNGFQKNAGVPGAAGAGVKGSGDQDGRGTGEAAVGLGLAGGLVVGLVVAGGGVRWLGRSGRR